MGGSKRTKTAGELAANGEAAQVATDHAVLPLASLPDTVMAGVLAHLEPSSRHALFATCHALSQAVVSCSNGLGLTIHDEDSSQCISRKLKTVARLLTLPLGPACMRRLDLTLQPCHMQLLPLVSAQREGRVREMTLEVSGLCGSGSHTTTAMICKMNYAQGAATWKPAQAAPFTPLPCRCLASQRQMQAPWWMPVQA